MHNPPFFTHEGAPSARTTKTKYIIISRITQRCDDKVALEEQYFHVRVGVLLHTALPLHTPHRVCVRSDCEDVRWVRAARLGPICTILGPDAETVGCVVLYCGCWPGRPGRHPRVGSKINFFEKQSNFENFERQKKENFGFLSPKSNLYWTPRKFQGSL